MSSFKTPNWTPFMGVGEVDLERVGTRNAAIAREAYEQDLEPKYYLFDPNEPKLTRSDSESPVDRLFLFSTARLLAVLSQCPPGFVEVEEIEEKVAEVFDYSPDRANRTVKQGIQDLRQHHFGKVESAYMKRNWRVLRFDLGDITLSTTSRHNLDLAPHPVDELSVAGLTVRNPIGRAQTIPRSRRRHRTD